MKKPLLIGLVAMLAFVLLACGNDEEAANDAEQRTLEELEFTDEELVDEDKLIIEVNKADILGSEYNQIYRQLKTVGHMYGQNVSDHEMLRKDVVTYLIEQELISQDAKEHEIVVSKAEAEAELKQLKEESGEEVVAAMLEQYVLTEEEFQNQLIDDITLRKYIDKTIEVEVTESEVKERFALLKEESDELSDDDFIEYEPQLRQNLMQEKQSEQLANRIEALYEEAEINISL